MSLAILKSRALASMHAPQVTVEVHLANGLPSFTIVGRPATEVKESKDRMRAALQNTQFEFPVRRITVNLAPADLPKESGRFDLPIALGILAASGQINDDRLARHLPKVICQRPTYPDFSEVKGQMQAKRALEVAAAGAHSVLLIGPPDTGKTMLAARFAGILSAMNDQEALGAAVQMVCSGFNLSRWKTRPYRAPHHTASGVALVSGDSHFRNY